MRDWKVKDQVQVRRQGKGKRQAAEWQGDVHGYHHGYNNGGIHKEGGE